MDGILYRTDLHQTLVDTTSVNLGLSDFRRQIIQIARLVGRCLDLLDSIQVEVLLRRIVGKVRCVETNGQEEWSFVRCL